MCLASNRATLVFLLSKAFKELFSPRMLVIEHSFGDGYFCHEANWEPIAAEEIRSLEQNMTELIANKNPISFDYMEKEAVLEYFHTINSRSRQEIVKQWDGERIPIVRFEDYWDYQLEPLNTDKKKLSQFKLQQYNDGFLIRFPATTDQQAIGIFHDRPKLFSIFEEHEQWGSILGVTSIRDLNELIRSGEIKELLWVAEGLHEKKISDIADGLVTGFPEKRVICVAGPSSSGKTTFAKRLRIQMRVNGFHTKQISMDDYFFDRSLIAVDENGKQDFESIAAVNSKLLCERLETLLNGGSIPVRHFDFGSGVGRDEKEMLKLGEWDFVLLEGIHGLNPVLSENIGAQRLQKIYISAITQLNVDANHHIFTSDNRLVRRMLRDHKFRNYSPEQTLARWPSVRQGEEQYIFPYQEEADFMFNSALVYEFPVLSRYVQPLLKNVRDSSELKVEAKRLETLLSFFEPLDEQAVPGISILREFIGKSEFEY